MHLGKPVRRSALIERSCEPYEDPCYGAEGYIGSVLVPYFMQRGHTVTRLDAGYYREDWLFCDRVQPFPRCVKMDIRNVAESDVCGFNANVHLAKLSNDSLANTIRS